jgi:ABC-2 type transport system ATP-binding protein
MALDLFQPDTGEIAILGGSMTEAKKRLIGYMPEERGLYQEIPVDRCILYLASLKGMEKTEANRRMESLMDRFDLLEHRKKKVKELSKGMQQKAQIISTVIHDPELVIVDEPFSGLDPINSQLVRDLMEDLRNRGKTIVMSTHQMGQVEELCDRLMLINRGKVVLYGELDEIRRRFSTGAVLVHTKEPLPEIAGVLDQEAEDGMVRLRLDETTTPRDVLKALLAHDVGIEKYEIAMPSLNEIFIEVVGSRNGDGEAAA